MVVRLGTGLVGWDVVPWLLEHDSSLIHACIFSILRCRDRVRDGIARTRFATPQISQSNNAIYDSFAGKETQERGTVRWLCIVRPAHMRYEDLMLALNRG